MRRDVFHFKQFGVSNSLAPMPLTTDSVLVGAWCHIPAEASLALDAGTGCGIVALMLAQRAGQMHIDAIDIDPDSVSEATANAASSPWPGRIAVSQADFNQWEGRYDLVVSNPPFFTDGILSPSEARAVARHTLSLTIGQLVAHGAQLLSPRGRLSFITPCHAASLVTQCAAFSAVNIVRMCEVVPVEGKPPKRMMWELSHSAAPLVRERLVISDAHGNATDQYRNLCRDFYLKF